MNFMSSTSIERSPIRRLVLLAAAASFCRAQAATDSTACKLPESPNTYLSAGFFDPASFDGAPSTGTLRGLIVFVDFSDEPATETPQSLGDIFSPASEAWYTASSYGKLALNLTVDTSRFYRMPKSAADYQFSRGLTYEAHLGYIQDAFEVWQKTTQAQLSGRGNPLADVLYVITTSNAKSISTSATLQSTVSTRNGELVARRAVTLGPDPGETWTKAFEHESGHTMGLPDMYPMTSEPPSKWAGNWDLMATLTGGQSRDFFAWNKWRLGWISDEQVECVTSAGSTMHRLTPLHTSGGIKAVVVKRSETAALVAEVRSKDGMDACAKGVLLYTVDTTLATGQGPFRVVDGNPGVGSCGWDELDNAPLSLQGGGTSSLAVPGWGVTVTVTEQVGDGFVVRVEKS